MTKSYFDIPPPIDPNNLDRTTSPLEDFYRFANGGWLDKNPIPSDYSRWGCFEELAERNYLVLKKLLEEAEQRPGDLVGELYSSGMNEAAIEEAGLSGIQDLLQEIGQLSTPSDVVKMVAKLHSEGMGIEGHSPLFSLSASPDARNSSWVLSHLSQDGIGLPDRDYYFDQDKAEIREKYKQHLKNMFALANLSNNEQKAAYVYEIEEFLATASLTMVERRDPIKTYNKKTLTELKSLCAIDWDNYFLSINMKQQFGDLILDNPTFFVAVQDALKKFPVTHWQAYLTWFVLGSSAPYLPKAIDDESFQFYKKTLTGQDVQKPRWKRVMSTVSSLIRDLFGKLYVEVMFSPEAKKQALEMVELLRTALRERLSNLEWMDESTREKALEKLNRFRVKIGYPDKWEEYPGVSLKRSLPYLENVRRASRAEVKKSLNRVNVEVERWRWEMPPFMVNAYYHPVLNEIVFPAAILQPPFFFAPTAKKPLGEAPVNFGGIGAVIGHEMTHGYDDQGRQFDASGNLVDWWTEEDANRFKARAKIIIDQFNGYTVYEKHVNGELTQGENIADLGGAKISYQALQMWMKVHGRPLDMYGFTPEQQFFLSWAQVWRNNIKKENALMRIVSDPHSPGVYRTNGPLTNLQEFFDAFGEAEPSQGMYREKEKRVQIW